MLNQLQQIIDTVVKTPVQSFTIAKPYSISLTNDTVVIIEKSVIGVYIAIYFEGALVFEIRYSDNSNSVEKVVIDERVVNIEQVKSIVDDVLSQYFATPDK